MNVEPVNELVALHLRKRLQLVTAETPPGIAVIQGDPDPDVLVAELLQLALFGAHVREMAAANPTMEARDLVANADFNVVRPA